MKYEAELEDCSKELERLKEKNSKIRNDLASKEEENIVLSAVIKQKEVLVEQLEQVGPIIKGGNKVFVIHSLKLSENIF